MQWYVGRSTTFIVILPQVEFLIKECKINLNVRDNYGDTALNDAAKFGHEKIVKMLLEAGAGNYTHIGTEETP